MTEDERRQYNIDHPIFGTNLKRPVSEIATECRQMVYKARNVINDLQIADMWSDRFDHIEGLLTCGLVCLYNVIEEIQKVEAKSKLPTKEDL